MCVEIKHKWIACFIRISFEKCAARLFSEKNLSNQYITVRYECSQARLLQSSSTAAVKLDCCSQAQLNLQLLSSAKTGAKLSCKRKFKIVRVHSVGFLET